MKEEIEGKNYSEMQTNELHHEYNNLQNYLKDINEKLTHITKKKAYSSKPETKPKSLSEQKKIMEIENETTKKQLEQKKLEFKAAQGRLETLASDTYERELDSKIEHLNDEIKRLKRENKDITLQIKKKSSQLERIRNDNDQPESIKKKNDLLKDEKVLERDNERLTKRLADMQKAVEDARKQLSESDEKYQQALQIANHHDLGNYEELAEAKKKYRNLKQEVILAEKNHNFILSQQSKRVEDFKKDLRTKENLNFEMERELENLRKISEELDGKVEYKRIVEIPRMLMMKGGFEYRPPDIQKTEESIPAAKVESNITKIIPKENSELISRPIDQNPILSKPPLSQPFQSKINEKKIDEKIENIEEKGNLINFQMPIAHEKSEINEFEEEKKAILVKPSFMNKKLAMPKTIEPQTLIQNSQPLQANEETKKEGLGLSLPWQKKEENKGINLNFVPNQNENENFTTHNTEIKGKFTLPQEKEEKVEVEEQPKFTVPRNRIQQQQSNYDPFTRVNEEKEKKVETGINLNFIEPKKEESGLKLNLPISVNQGLKFNPPENTVTNSNTEGGINLFAKKKTENLVQNIQTETKFVVKEEEKAPIIQKKTGNAGRRGKGLFKKDSDDEENDKGIIDFSNIKEITEIKKDEENKFDIPIIEEQKRSLGFNSENNKEKDKVEELSLAYKQPPRLRMTNLDQNNDDKAKEKAKKLEEKGNEFFAEFEFN